MNKLPKTQGEFFSRIHSTINRLKDKSRNEIAMIQRHLQMDMLLPFSAVTSFEVKREAADKIAEIEDGAQLITDYLWFLWELGLESDEKVSDCYRYVKFYPFKSFRVADD